MIANSVAIVEGMVKAGCRQSWAVYGVFMAGVGMPERDSISYCLNRWACRRLAHRPHGLPVATPCCGIGMNIISSQCRLRVSHAPPVRGFMPVTPRFMAEHRIRPVAAAVCTAGRGRFAGSGHPVGRRGPGRCARWRVGGLDTGPGSSWPAGSCDGGTWPGPWHPAARCVCRQPVRQAVTGHGREARCPPSSTYPVSWPDPGVCP